MVVNIVVFFKRLFKLPQFLALVAYDAFWWLVRKGWLIFEGWGLHLYVGKFGAGKTSTLVHDAYSIAKAYPDVTILTNFKLCNFPAHTKVLPLRTAQDIINAPDNTLVLIDEIGTIFNSRDFVGGAKSVPKILFQHICQCRKRRKMILATTQRWNFLDKQLRDITATVTVTRMHFKHPFSRLATCYTYDAVDYDLCFSNPNYTPVCIGTSVYVQTDKLRNLYDTAELVDTMLNAEYVSDAEILENRGELPRNVSELTRKGSKGVRRNAGKT